MPLSKKCFPVILAVGLSSLCPVAHALEFGPSIGAGLAYTDNADLAHEEEESDIVAIGYLGAQISEDSGPLQFSVDSAVTYQKYLEDTVGDETYFNLGSRAEWEQIRDRLYWDVSDYYTQRKIQSLEADRTSNLQNTNVFTLGPRMLFRPSAAHSISANLQFKDFYYQNSNTGNQQYELATGWLYQMRPTKQIGLDAGVNVIDYDDEDQNPNSVSSTVHAVLSATGPHTSYTYNFGVTHVSRDRFDSATGFSGDATWSRILAGHSSLRFHLATQLTNSSDNLLNSQTDPDNGSFDSEQINGDVVRNTTMTIVYSRTNDALYTNIRVQAQDLDYKESPDDRKIYELGVDLSYDISPLINGGLKGFYRYVDEDETNRKDKEYSIIGSISYSMSRDLRSEFAVRFQNKSSDIRTEEYTEAAVFIGLIWGGGAVPHTGVL